jgi:hypothetical protein
VCNELLAQVGGRQDVETVAIHVTVSDWLYRLLGAWPFGVVEANWALVAIRRWMGTNSVIGVNRSCRLAAPRNYERSVTVARGASLSNSYFRAELFMHKKL